MTGGGGGPLQLRDLGRLSADSTPAAAGVITSSSLKGDLDGAKQCAPQIWNGNSDEMTKVEMSALKDE